MIAEHAESAIKGKNVYLRFPTNDEAKAFFNALNAQNKNLNDKIITFNFGTEQDAKEFFDALNNKFKECQKGAA